MTSAHAAEWRHGEQMRVIAAMATVAALLVAPVSSAAAAEMSLGKDSVRIDKQDTQGLVTVTGLSRKDRVSVDWGDGTPRVKVSTSCSVARAKANPQSCSDDVGHLFERPGTYQVSLFEGKKKVSATPLTVIPVPVRGSDNRPHAGDWTTLGSRGQATFYPCQEVLWFLDTSLQPPNAAGTRGDIEAALAVLAPATGLRFTQVSSKEQAQLVYRWENLGAGIAGRGGGHLGSAEVQLNPQTRWAGDDFGGLDLVTREWEENGTRWQLTTPGRAWLIIHETMHALGVGHSGDPSEVMYSGPTTVTALGVGDRDALASLYLENPCPAML